jgi:nitrate/nitrite transporter NarK
MIWSLPSRFLTGAQAAAAIAMINAVGNLGGGFGPMGIAVVVDRTGSVATGLYVLAAVVAIAVVATFAIQRVIEKPRSDVRHFA